MNIIETFFLSVLAMFVFASCQNSTEAQSEVNLESENTNRQNKVEQTKSVTPEQKAVRLAEEFIKRNGYTGEPADKENLTPESIEFYGNRDEVLESRKNTLEAKAFAVSPYGKGNQKGWTVAFRFNKDYLKDLGDRYKTHGRGVTMDENFENLRVEHSDIFLHKLEKNLQ